jgi:hypothetical protein
VDITGVRNPLGLPLKAEDLLLAPPALLLEPAAGKRSEPQDPERGPWNHADRAEGEWGSFNTRLLVHEPKLTPDELVPGERWQTEEALKVSVAGPLFLFGQVGVGFDTLTAQQQRLSSRTGLGCRLVPCKGSEILVHGGPALTRAEDPLRPDLLPRGRAEMLLEVQCRYPLLTYVNVEYQGVAVPAVTPLERNRLDQDLRFAVPLGTLGDFRLGAKHHWEETDNLRPLGERMELYLGVGLSR